jgi:hypothetical protein
VTGIDPSDQQAFVQARSQRRRRLRRRRRDAVAHGAVVERRPPPRAIDLDVDERTRGQALWLTTPTAEDLVAPIQRVRKASRSAPDTLCLVGWPDTLPMAIVGDARPIDADLVSDVPLAQTDADPFVDLAAARFVAEDLPSATLLACRGFAQPSFRDRAYAHRFATAEWAAAGTTRCRRPRVWCGGPPRRADFVAAGSLLTGAGLIQHGSHAMWTELGRTCAWTRPSCSPRALVMSSGAARRRSTWMRSTVRRRCGCCATALAFVGNRRRGAASRSCSTPSA